MDNAGFITPARRYVSLLLVVTGSVFSLTSCSDSTTTTESLRSVIAAAGISGDPTTGRDLPDISDARAQLGMKVFFSKNMGLNNKDSACVTCHHPVLGGGDDLSLPVGVEAEVEDLLGPGRFHAATATNYDGGPPVPRNAPTTFNAGLWDRAMFHDGRVEAITPAAGQNGDSGGISTPDSGFGVADANAGGSIPAAQSRFPVTSHEEMRAFGDVHGTDNAALRADLVNNDMAAFWDAEFNAVYTGNRGVAGTDPANPYARIAEVIAEYERSQVFVDNPWKAFVEGDDDAISESAKRGALLFFRDYESGGANCAACHSGDFFTDEDFHAWAMPQVGRGKGNGPTMDDDFGRFNVTAAPADMYAFRTPTLLNVAVTGPWTHAGAYTSLEAVVRHKMNPAAALAAYDYSQIDASIQASNLAANGAAALASGIDPTIRIIDLSGEQVDDIVAFLHSLTDPCVTDRACLAPWIPDADDTDPDALRLDAIDANGNAL